ncbi:hypothetical protein ABIE44_003461 [Marmoricola sp. OAE513]|uniref:hypothetical protein n=1 Tax=Marmoricola sp. OAE513 TaxID=2817894 RepID=UPI001AEA5C88
MSYERLAYDDQDTTVKMHTDCTACASEMGIPDQRASLDILGDAPSMEYVDYREMPKPVINVDEATAHLAARLHLHLD